jgi:heptosyltransferase-2
MQTLLTLIGIAAAGYFGTRHALRMMRRREDRKREKQLVFLQILMPKKEGKEDKEHLAYTAQAAAQVEEYIGPHASARLVGISPAAGNRIKQWPPERFAAVANHLAGRGFVIVVLGGKNDAKEVAAMLAELKPETKVLNLAGKVSIDELKALMQHLSLFISVDTGPIYIAEAFGVPTVDIVGPVDEREQPPIGEKHVVVVPKRTKPELYVMNPYPKDQTEARRQTESITAQEIIEAADALLDQLQL